MSSHQELSAKFKDLSGEIISGLKGSKSPEREEILREAQKLVQQLQTPAEYALPMLWAPIELAITAAACEMGIFTALARTGKPITVSDITKASKSDDEGIVQRIVQGLAAHGTIDQIDDQQYKANEKTINFATNGRHGGAMTQMFSMRAYSCLPWVLRKNGYRTPPDLKHCCWQEAYGDDSTMWQWMKENPEMGQYFNDYMAAARPYTSGSFVDEYPFHDLCEGTKPEDVIFVDVGGGFGHQCVALRKAFPKGQGRIILQDLPQVVEGKKLEDIEVMAHDMMTEQPVKGAKAYYFRGVLHDHADSVCKQFLQQIVKAMGPESRLLVHDVIIEDFMPTIQSVRQDVGMMCLFAGRERTKAQMKGLLESVGLKVVETYKAGPEKWSITEAKLAD